ncbi:hypothetical protein VNI00_008121 [Paramarasmius palmivorus]|uniref:F-box domain-containing protein n=1 Tax=Paramarasmius palmivorus TaxID=297713 RepID=A0AAW0CV40_9AGAR
MSTQTQAESILPQELWDIIVKAFCGDIKVLKRLSLVCKALSTTTRQHLFRRITIHGDAAGEPHVYDSRSPGPRGIKLDEFVRLCEHPLSTWSPRVIKKLKFWPCLWRDSYTRFLLQAISAPCEYSASPAWHDPIASKLDIARTKKILRSLTALELHFAYFGGSHTSPAQFLPTTFPSLRCLALNDLSTVSIQEVWDIFLSYPLLEEFGWSGGSVYDDLQAPLQLNGQQLPKLHSFSFSGGRQITLRRLMPVFSRLPMTKLRTYSICPLWDADLPEVSTLLKSAGLGGPNQQQWTLDLSSLDEYPDRHTSTSIVQHICLTQNPRISQITFSSWILLPEILRRYTTLSRRNNIKSIILPDFRVCSDSERRLSNGHPPLKEIDEILDHDVFLPLEALHFHARRFPGSLAKILDSVGPPADEKVRSARWGVYESMLVDIEERQVPRAIQKGIWKLHTTGKEWED